MSSAPRREPTKQIVRRPAIVRSASRSEDSASTDRREPGARSGSGGVPLPSRPAALRGAAGGGRGGFHLGTRRAAVGAPAGVNGGKAGPPRPPGGPRGLGVRRGGGEEGGWGPEARGPPPQPPQHVGDVGPEDAAVDVRL